MLVKHEKDGSFWNKKLTLSGTQVIVLGFIALIIVGGIILTLPISSRNGTWTSPVNALFTATTATCVTGLVVVDTYTHWSFFGQLIILALIQIGGLGFMTIAIFFFIILNRHKKIGIRQRLIISETFSMDSISGVVRLLKKVVIVTVLIELIGTVMFSIRFIPEFGPLNGLFKALFHSISSFCNAGIDLMGEKSPYSSMVSYSGDTLINLTMCALIIIGGLGFLVWEDMWHFLTERRALRLHSKLVLSISTILIVGGTILFFIFEYNNPYTMSNMSLYNKILASFFQSVTTRTAGYNTVNISSLSNASVLITLALMFIGGSPGSTAGGTKTTTVGLLVLSAKAVAKGSPEVHIWGRRIEDKHILRALTIMVVSVLLVGVGSLLICLFDNLPFKESLFETISAFGTVGLTMGVTPMLSTASKFIIMCLMFLGRVGVLTTIFAIAKRQHNYEGKISYPKGSIMF